MFFKLRVVLVITGVWEEKTKHHVFRLICNGASLRSFAGSLWSFVNILWSFAGTLWSLFLVVCGFLLVVCDSLSSFVVVVDLLCSFEVV